MHHIQRKILSKLMHAPSLSYAQMRPKGVESNHFAYHLEQLLRAGIVTKQDRSYSLTTEGLALVDRLSHDQMTIRRQPHIVTVIDITNDAGQTLLFKYNFQPYLNLYGFPQGRVHYEEHIAEAAQRELQEKTGLTGISLEHRGLLYIHATKADQDISKILAHVFSGTVTGQPELSPDNKGTCSWDDASKYNAGECMPGFREIKKMLEEHTSGLFFAEIDAVLSTDAGSGE